MVGIPLITVFHGGPNGYIPTETIVFWAVLLIQTWPLFHTIPRGGSTEGAKVADENGLNSPNSIEIDEISVPNMDEDKQEV